jgi:hypothetical protein
MMATIEICISFKQETRNKKKEGEGKKQEERKAYMAQRISNVL